MAYVPTQSQRASLLAWLRPRSYRKAISPRNRVRQPRITAEDDNLYKQSHVRDHGSQNQINEQLKASRIFYRISGGSD
jgi:hypothetical protein